jgi:ABC-type nitrate/sulfonate/bicarbonate transport system substrate-binding protein
LILIILVGSPVRASPQEKKLEPITVSYASITGNRAPFWIAKELGIFEKHGLDVNLIYIASGFTSVNALLGGSVDIEDLSHTYPQLKGKKAAEFFDVTLLKELEGEGFFARLHQRQ